MLTPFLEGSAPVVGLFDNAVVQAKGGWDEVALKNATGQDMRDAADDTDKETTLRQSLVALLPPKASQQLEHNEIAGNLTTVGHTKKDRAVLWRMVARFILRHARNVFDSEFRSTCRAKTRTPLAKCSSV